MAEKPRLLDLPMAGLMDVWSDLVLMLCGKGTHGDETELYVYRLSTAHRPSSQLDVTDGEREADSLDANARLLELVRMFEERYGVKVFAGTPKGWRHVGPWIVQSRNWHRWHLEARRPKRKGPAALGLAES